MPVGKAAGLAVGRHAAAMPLERRQDDSSSSTALTASPASVPSGAASAASTTSSLSAGEALTTASAVLSDGSNGPFTITKILSIPAFTATATTPYKAHGVNATVTKPGTSTYTSENYLETASATAPGIPDNELTACKIVNSTGDNGPFCSPIHEQNLWVGYTYSLTWNSALFPLNASDQNLVDEYVVLRYADGSQDVAWSSPLTLHGTGYVNVNMNKDWLLGAPGNDTTSGQNLTMFLGSSAESPVKGPTISLTVNPRTLPRVLIPKISNKYGLEIGLPVGIVGALMVIFAIWCGMRKHDRSWKDIGHTGKDYMARRRRRGGGGRRGGGKGGDIQLNDWETSPNGDQFTDEPYQGGSKNAFRDEIKRQREEDDGLKRTVTSY
ncbi:hypothetical protein MMC28_007566 [Mycoblastus sanguinarius]|nr:hypothetical protein [Mycoblastus sanguinarius]